MTVTELGPGSGMARMPDPLLCWDESDPQDPRASLCSLSATHPPGQSLGFRRCLRLVGTIILGRRPQSCASGPWGHEAQTPHPVLSGLGCHSVTTPDTPTQVGPLLTRLLSQPRVTGPVTSETSSTLSPLPTTQTWDI